MRPASIAPLLALAASLFPHGSSAWTTDPAVNQPVCVASGDQGAPRAIAAGSEETIVAWRDGRAGGQIFAQRLDADGQPLWTVDGIALGPAGATSDPWLVTDGAGGAVIAWVEDTGTTRALKAQRLSAGGAALWTDGGVTLRARADRLDGDVSIWLWDLQAAAEDGAGGLSFAMQERHEEVSAVYPGRYTKEILLLHCDATGAVESERSVQADEYICTFSCGDGFFHLDQYSDLRLAAGTGGAALVAFRLRRIVNHGVIFLAPEIRLADPAAGWAVTAATAAGDVRRPRIVAAPEGGAYATWEDEHDGAITIRAARVNAGGTLAWGGGVPVCPAGGGDQVGQEMFADAAGPAVAWLDGRNAQVDVYAQRLDLTGAPQWSPAGVPVCLQPSAEVTLAIARTQAGSAAIVWRDVRNGAGDVYGRVVSAAGVPLGAADGFPVSIAAGEQDAPVVVPAGIQAVAVWRDRRGSSADVYAQRIGAQGPVSGPEPPPSPSGIALLRIEPNPSPGATSIWLRLSRPTEPTVWIADLRGTHVAGIATGTLPAGDRVLRWDGRDREGREARAGIYLLVLDADGRRLARRLAVVR